jgi:hypothetical protein
VTFPGFTTTKILNIHTNLVGTGLQVKMRNDILTCIGFGIVDTGIPVIAKGPADPGRFAVIVMLW